MSETLRVVRANRGEASSSSRLRIAAERPDWDTPQPALGGRSPAAVGALALSCHRSQSCHAAGIDITQSPVIPGGVSAIYLFITSHDGEMELAVSDMAIYEEMTPDFIKARLDTINRAAACVSSRTRSLMRST